MATQIIATMAASSNSFDGGVVIDESMMQEGKKSDIMIIVEAEKSELFGVEVKSDEEAYELYNDNTFRVGFSIRKSKTRFKADNTLVTREFCCWKAGEKTNKGIDNKAYTKMDERTGCSAKIRFDIDDKGVWKVTLHDMEHNHTMCPLDKRHLLRSHRNVKEADMNFVKCLVEHGVSVADAIRVVKGQKGGSPLAGFTSRDIYNKLGKDRKIDGYDANEMIQIFKRRQSIEKDFYYDLELDEEGRLCNLFWRDGRMKADYDLFGDSMGHDTTYRTNKYEMICAPFVGINHHGKNVMFGCGFLLNEKTESFVWLFQTFLKSMSRVPPKTIMTDQCAAMATAISKVFPTSCHRLCNWHIIQNSKTNIKGLRNKEGFNNIFNYCLMHCDTEAEFNFFWDRLLSKYQCHDNEWLKRLYGLREKWCPAFSKDYFSGGVLSSQRSETTNKSVSERLHKTARLCDFYRSFVDVVCEWRSKEKGEDFQNWQGQMEMAFGNINILVHARSLYTSEVYLLIEAEFIKGTTCYHQFIESEASVISYFVWREGTDMLRHVVHFDQGNHCISCTCKLFLQTGVLCFHCFRVYNLHCVQVIPSQYIMKRWTKNLQTCSAVCDVSLDDRQDSVSASVWRTQTLRKFNDLISSCDSNPTSRLLCEVAYQNLRDAIKQESGHSFVEEAVDSNNSLNTVMIKNPRRSRIVGERNTRKKPIIEKMANVVRGRKKVAVKNASRLKATVQASIQEVLAEMMGRRQGFLAHPLGGGSLVHMPNNEENSSWSCQAPLSD